MLHLSGHNTPPPRANCTMQMKAQTLLWRGGGKTARKRKGEGRRERGVVCQEDVGSASWWLSCPHTHAYTHTLKVHQVSVCLYMFGLLVHACVSAEMIERWRGLEREEEGIGHFFFSFFRGWLRFPFSSPCPWKAQERKRPRDGAWAGTQPLCP